MHQTKSSELSVEFSIVQTGHFSHFFVLPPTKLTCWCSLLKSWLVSALSYRADMFVLPPKELTCECPLLQSRHVCAPSWRADLWVPSPTEQTCLCSLLKSWLVSALSYRADMFVLPPEELTCLCSLLTVYLLVMDDGSIWPNTGDGVETQGNKVFLLTGTKIKHNCK